MTDNTMTTEEATAVATMEIERLRQVCIDAQPAIRSAIIHTAVERAENSGKDGGELINSQIIDGYDAALECAERLDEMLASSVMSHVIHRGILYSPQVLRCLVDAFQRDPSIDDDLLHALMDGLNEYRQENGMDRIDWWPVEAR